MRCFFATGVITPIFFIFILIHALLEQLLYRYHGHETEARALRFPADRFSFYTTSLTPFTKLNIKCGQQYLLLPKHKNFHVRLFLRSAKTNIV